MNDLLQVPTFSRLSDYLGVWSMSPIHFAQLWQATVNLDMRAHMAEPLKPMSVVEKVPGPGEKSIALIRLTGILMKSASSMGGTSTIQARRDIRNAAADPNIAGILLAIDSPGGSVSGTDDLAADVKAAQKSKPVWAHAEDLMASAAFWVASQAGRITANSPTALIGSIGTIQVIQDLSAMAEREGVKTLVFSTGPLKGLGAPGSKVTEDQQAHVQALVNAVQGSFDAAVQKGRGLNAKELLAVRHGGVMTAPAAMEAKLIDGIQPLAKTVSEFAKALATGTAGSYRQAALTNVEPKARSLPMRTSVLPVLERL